MVWSGGDPGQQPPTHFLCLGRPVVDVAYERALRIWFLSLRAEFPRLTSWAQQLPSYMAVMTVMPDLFFRWVWSLGVPLRERELPRPSVVAALLVHSLPLEADRSASQALPPGFPEDRAPRVCGVCRPPAVTGLEDAESGRRSCASLPAGAHRPPSGSSSGTRGPRRLSSEHLSALSPARRRRRPQAPPQPSSTAAGSKPRPAPPQAPSPAQHHPRP